MARGDTGNTSYLSVDTSPISGYPLTMAMRCKIPTPNTSSRYAFHIGEVSSAYTVNGFNLGVSNTEYATITAYDSGGGASTTTTNGATMSPGDWFVSAAAITDATTRRIVRDGDSGTFKTGSTSRVITNLDCIAIGTRYGSTKSGNLLKGQVDWVALWDAALSDADLLKVTGGAHPYTVAPGNLQFFIHLSTGTGSEVDTVGGRTLAETGTVDEYEGLLLPYGGPMVVTREAGAAPSGGLVGSLAGYGGLAGMGGLAGRHGGLAA